MIPFVASCVVMVVLCVLMIIRDHKTAKRFEEAIGHIDDATDAIKGVAERRDSWRRMMASPRLSARVEKLRRERRS